jgi:hypothetical protein
MLVLASGVFADPDTSAPGIGTELTLLHSYKKTGIVVDAYQRVDGKGFAIIWRVASLDEARERLTQLRLRWIVESRTRRDRACLNRSVSVDR